MTDNENLAVLRAATVTAGLDCAGAELIRLAENALYRLPGGIVARVARIGQCSAAAKEVKVARWLEDSGVSAVRVFRGLEQPVHVGGRAVTFWHELPKHEEGTTADVAMLIRQFHRLDPPTGFELPELAPFVRLADRIREIRLFTEDDRAWLLERLTELELAYTALPPGLPWCVIHGDAWAGNVVRTAEGGVVLLDLERCAFGPPEWDLTIMAVDYVTTGCIDDAEWSAYCDIYGHDVTSWAGFATLRDIRELRWTTFAAQVAGTNLTTYADQAKHRLACLQGHHGPRPWTGWHAVP